MYFHRFYSCNYEDWLNVCVSVERVSDRLRQKKSVKIVRWIIVGIILIPFVIYIPNPLYRRIINDNEVHRTWCIIRYPSLTKAFDFSLL